MTDLLFPPGINIARNRFRYLDSTGISRSPFGGVTRTAALLGDRLGATIETVPVGGKDPGSVTDRAALIAFIALMQGQQNRAYLWDHAYRQRGSYLAPELMSNSDFASGAAAPWTLGTDFAGSLVYDNVLRVTRTGNTGVSDLLYQVSASLALGIPYHGRAMLMAGSYPNSIALDERSSGGSQLSVGTAVSGFGMARHTFVAQGAGGGLGMKESAATLAQAGDYVMVPYISLARCALADISTNLLLQSDDLTTTWANTRSTDAANSLAAPDGSTTADSLIEDATASATHFIAQTVTVGAAAADFCFSVCLKAGTRTWAMVELFEATGSSVVNQYINLATGALGTATTGANWASTRVTVTNLGNGWYRVGLVSRKTNAATSLTARIYLATADVTNSYSGTGTSLIYAWRAGLAVSGVAFLPGATTTTASAGTAPTGNSMRLKGLPASTTGLLLPGDWVELQSSRGSELKLVTAPLNSDAGGLGLLQLSPRLRGTVADNAGVIVNRPMGKFVYTQDVVEWSTEPGVYSSGSFELEEST